MAETTSKEYSSGQKFAAWCVHLFTASGIVAGFFAIVAISNHNFFLAFGLLFLTLVIDGIDGTFARMCNAKEVLPQMSGKTIDYVVDFATYAIIPTYLMYEGTIGGVPLEEGGQYLLPNEYYLREISAAIILLVSGIYYGKEGMVSNDMYFIGFPVMWNAVAFYVYYVFWLPPMGNLVVIIICAILHFVPMKFLYPSRTKKFMKMNILFTTLAITSGLGLMTVLELEWANKAVFEGELPKRIIQILAIVSLSYFFVLSIYHTYIDKDTKDTT